MGKIEISDISKFEETLVTFKKEDDGTYTKITKTLTRNRITGAATHQKKIHPIVEEGPYILTSNLDDYDEKMEYQDFKGKPAFLYFKGPTVEWEEE